MRPRNIEAIYRLTPLQEGILYHTLETPAADIYFQQFSCVLEDLLDVEHWQAAWRLCAQRHPALRTLFTWEKREHPLQIVRPEVELPWQVLDWRELTHEDQKTHFLSLCRRDRDRGFDLSRPPLIRFTLAQVADSSYYFLWSFHHILLDGWSQRMLLGEALAAYRCRHETDSSRAENKPPPYAQFITWLEQRDTRSALDYWRARFHDFEHATAVAQSGPIPGDGAALNTALVQELDLGIDSAAALTGAAKAAQVTLNTMVVAAWALVLGMRCRSKDVVFGTTVSGRPVDLAGSSRIAGLFVNTLPLRVIIPEKDRLADWLRSLQSAQLRNREHEHSSLADIQRCSGIRPGSALFDNILVFENLPEDTAGATAKDSPRVIDPQFVEFSHYPLAILADPGIGLKLIAVHRVAQIAETDASALLQQIATVLRQFADALDAPVEQISLLTPSERSLMEVEWNQSHVPMPEGECIHHLFERCAARFPARAALVTDTVQLTFDQLNANANRLARYLIEQGMVPGSLVVVFLPRDVNAITGFLAILKGGGAYIPVDVDAPPERVSQILKEVCGHKALILTQGDLREKLPQNDLISICVDFERSDIAAHDGHNLALPIDPLQLAYVIYTSGSTGTPKGVMIEHHSLVNSTRARLDFYPEQPGIFLLLSSLAVDSSVAGIYWCLCAGATLVLPRHRQEQDVERIGEIIRQQSVTHLLCIPSLYQLLVAHNSASRLASLRTVIVAGEACPAPLIQHHRELLPETGLYNEYGPSECTVWASVSDLSHWRPRQNVPIGRPVANTLLYILDKRLCSVPRGVAGELFVGGAGLARGYLERPELTRESFVDAATVCRPFDTPNRRLYRTGDLVRYAEDGQIEFLGRVDNQIKVRGYRVEPEEIEHVLARHAAIREVVVFLDAPVAAQPPARHNAPPSGLGTSSFTGNSPGRSHFDQKLIACVTTVPGSSLGLSELRDYAGEHLAAHLVPQIFRHVADFPRSGSGKIDRQALAVYEWTDLWRPENAGESLILPETQNEKILTEIWKDVLGVAELGIHSDFFELGGDSLLSIRVLSRARKAGLAISSDDFFAHPTIAGQARLAHEPATVVVERSKALGELNLAPIQHWFFQHIEVYPEHWNQSLLLCVKENLDYLSLERALQALLLHHDGLRTIFRRRENARQPFIPECQPELPLSRVDLSAVPQVELTSMLERETTDLNRKLDLERGPLVRLLFADTAPGMDNRLAIVIHHLLVDAESWRILLIDLESLWQGFATGGQAKLPARTTSYKYWVEQLQAYAGTPQLEEESAYWISIAEANAGTIPLDMHSDQAWNTNASVEVVSVSLDIAETQALLQEVPRKYNTEVNDALLAGLQMSLLNWSDVDAILVDVEGHGREPMFPQVETTRTVGWFTSVYPVLLSRLPGEQIAETLVRIKEQRRAIPKRGIGFGILRYLTGAGLAARRLAAVPSPQVCFNYLGQMDKLQLHSGSLQIELQNPGHTRAADGPLVYLIEVNCVVSDGQLNIELRYSNKAHNRSTVEGIASDFLAHLRSLFESCVNTGATVYSPSDFPLARLDQEELDVIGKLLSDGDDETLMLPDE